MRMEESLAMASVRLHPRLHYYFLSRDTVIVETWPRRRRLLSWHFGTEEGADLNIQIDEAEVSGCGSDRQQAGGGSSGSAAINVRRSFEFGTYVLYRCLDSRLSRGGQIQACRINALWRGNRDQGHNMSGPSRFGSSILSWFVGGVGSSAICPDSGETTVPPHYGCDG